MVVVECLVDFPRQTRPHIGTIAVPNRLHEQVLEARFLEDFT